MSHMSHFKPPLIRSESKALPRQKPMSRARSSIQTPRKNPPGLTRAAESSPKRIASTFYAPPGPAHSRTILTKLIGANPGQAKPTQSEASRKHQGESHPRSMRETPPEPNAQHQKQPSTNCAAQRTAQLSNILSEHVRHAAAADKHHGRSNRCHKQRVATVEQAAVTRHDGTRIFHA